MKLLSLTPLLLSLPAIHALSTSSTPGPSSSTTTPSKPTATSNHSALLALVAPYHQISAVFAPRCFLPDGSACPTDYCTDYLTRYTETLVIDCKPIKICTYDSFGDECEVKTNAPVKCPQTREELWGVIGKAMGMGRREVGRKWRMMEKTVGEVDCSEVVV